MLRWGLDKDSKELVDIVNAERGIKCNCICPACGVQLVAHKAEITHHFKHYRKEECISGIETAIHLKAKEIIASAKQIKLPSLSANESFGEFNGFVSILTPRVISLDDVRIEKKEGKIIPDIIATHKGKSLLIEIAVTHFVDRKKKNIIREQGISCIEIDLHELHNSTENITDEYLVRNIIERVDNKKWVHNAKYLSAKREALAQAISAEETSINEEKSRKESESKEFNNRILQVLKNNPKLKVNQHEIKCYPNGSNYIEYDINVELYETWRAFESEPHKFLVNIAVCTDDDSMHFNSIESGTRSVSNVFLESFIKKIFTSMSYKEGLYRWLHKRATH